jgi:hypothetical protein
MQIGFEFEASKGDGAPLTPLTERSNILEHGSKST